MKEFFTEMFIDIFQDGAIGIILGILFWFILLIVIAMVGYGVFYVADKTFTYEYTGQGTVTEKFIVPKHTITTYNKVGDIMIPSTVTVPTSYNLNIRIDGEIDDISISKKYYNKIKEGDSLKCEYQLGSLSNTLYVNSIYRLRIRVCLGSENPS